MDKITDWCYNCKDLTAVVVIPTDGSKWCFVCLGDEPDIQTLFAPYEIEEACPLEFIHSIYYENGWEGVSMPWPRSS